MSQRKDTRVLAIAIDAAEPTFIQRLISQHEMPALESLLSAGKWLRVKSPAHIGSGSVWPTFISGRSPQAHGVYGEWLWNASAMRVTRYHGNDLRPFWQRFVDDGLSVGILDVPFMPMIGLTKGFEISEWGPHDILEGRMRLAPASVLPTVAEHSPHPLNKRVQLTGPNDYQNLEILGEICLEGIQKRAQLARRLLSETQPQFAIVTFTEIHRSAHYLWHQVQPENPIYSQNGIAKLGAARPSLHEVFRDLDRQIKSLIATAGPDTHVVVFSLHGMQPAYGIPGFLAKWLCEKRFARMPSWRQQSWHQRSTTTFGTVKRAMPGPLKKVYYKVLPPTVTHHLARPTMLPLYDWSRTRAFALPTDQHGWIRINLAGREACGLVPKKLYDESCECLERELRNIRSETGAPLVENVFRTAESSEAAIQQRLPDLVVHWADAVFSSPLRLAGNKIKPNFDGRKYVGQHGLEGFCIVPRALADNGNEIRAEEMHILFSRLLQCSA